MPLVRAMCPWHIFISSSELSTELGTWLSNRSTNTATRIPNTQSSDPSISTALPPKQPLPPHLRKWHHIRLSSASCPLSPWLALCLPSPILLPVVLDLHSFPHKFHLDPFFSFCIDSFLYQDILSPGSCNSFLNSVLDSSILYALLLNYLPRHLIVVEMQFKSPTVVFWHILLHLKEKAMAPYSSTLAWRIPWMEEPGRLGSMGSRRVWHDWATSLSFSLSPIGEGNGNPLQCSCLENPRDSGAWWAAGYGVAQSRTRLKRLSSSSSSI